MTDNDESLLLRYRASVQDKPTPQLDEIIQAAARRRALQRRVLRGLGTVLFIATFTTLGSVAIWRWRQPDHRQSATIATNYGAIEDLTRPYLLQIPATDVSRPGALEDARQ